MVAGMNSIEIKNLTKTYDGFTLDNINFNLPSGTIMGLVGENGAGKSTIIKLIMNAITADSGVVAVLGCSNLSKEFIQIKQDIGIVLDDAYFPEVLNAKKICKIMAKTYENWNDSLFWSYIGKFKLPHDKKAKDYSRGMRMKLAIAVAISHEPKLLILDEATSGLDPMIRDEILDVFHEFTRDENHSVVLSSHIISDLEKIWDYITFIHKGKLLLTEEKDMLLEKYAITRLAHDEFHHLPAEAIISQNETSFGFEVLVLKDKINSAFRLEHTTLEDIVLFMAKESR